MKINWILAAVKNGLQDALVYRIEFFLQILGSALVPFIIQLLVWNALFSNDPNQTIAGATYSDVIQYTIASILFSQVRGGDLDFHIAELVRTGELSSYLLKPVNPLAFIYFRGSSPKFLISAISLVIGFCLSFYFNTSYTRIFGAMTLALLGSLIHFQISAILATVAFYWEEAYSVLMVKNMVVSLLSGELIPLYLFPDKFSWIWHSTPFYLYVFGPAQYMTGKWTNADLLQNLLIAMIWLVVSGIFLKIFWKIGLKKYISLGG